MTPVMPGIRLQMRQSRPSEAVVSGEVRTRGFTAAKRKLRRQRLVFGVIGK
jgi:hypothetical protein